MKSLGPLHITEIKSNQKRMVDWKIICFKLQNGTIADRFGENVNASSIYVCKYISFRWLFCKGIQTYIGVNLLALLNCERRRNCQLRDRFICMTMADERICIIQVQTQVFPRKTMLASTPCIFALGLLPPSITVKTKVISTKVMFRIRLKISNTADQSQTRFNN